MGEVLDRSDERFDFVDEAFDLVSEMRDLVRDMDLFVNEVDDLVDVKTLPKLAVLGEARDMSDDAKASQKRYFLIDARKLEPFARDLPAGAMRGMKREREGFPLVLQEIVDSQERWGKDAGVRSQDVDELVLLTKRIEMIREQLFDVRKLLEVLVETELAMDDRRQKLVGGIAKTIDIAASVAKDDTLLGIYENTRQYRSAAAQKGVKTRQRRASLRASEAAKAKG